MALFYLTSSYFIPFGWIPRYVSDGLDLDRDLIPLLAYIVDPYEVGDFVVFLCISLSKISGY